ncbi:MAG: tandem-95 repeat protein [Pseudomonadota bacterium]|nr:tandem-95 repeat protein [Pseudomonadota bacterium]
MNYFPALAAAVFLLVTAAVHADIVIVNGDSAGEGLNDPTPATAAGGNSGTTVGEQRLNVFSEAAGILNATFSISQTIAVNAQFNSLTCNASSGVLGSAGPTYSYSAVEDGVGTVYPIGLANEHFATDLIPAAEEIQATFNADLGTTGCLENTPWYYGYDAPPGTESSLLSVVLHELMHGMGFLSMLGEDGSAPDVHPDDGITEIYDPYSQLLYDASQAQRLTGLSQTERAAALLNDGNLLWDGAQTNANLSGLSAGVNGSRVQMYAPTVYESGSSVSHFDSAATPNEIMEPVYTEFLQQAGLARYVLGDIGWTLAAVTNSAPVLTAIADQVMDEDSTLTINLSATDADADSLTYAIDSAAAEFGASLSATLLSLNPQADYHGSGSITVSVSDGSATDSVTFGLTINAVNDAPLISAVADQSIDEDDSLSLTLEATDVDGDSLVFSLLSAPAESGAELNGSTLTFTPVADYYGSGSVGIQVSDGSLSSSTSFTLTINAVNDIPQFTSASNFTLAAEELLSLTLTADDKETASDALVFSLDSYDSAALTASLSGSLLSVTPVSGVSGTSTLTVSVSDGTVSSSQDIILTILSADNQAPQWDSLPAVSLLAGSSAAVTLSASDPDDDSLTFTVLSSSSGLSASLSGDQLTISAAESATDSGSVAVRVSDGVLTADSSVSVTVYPAFSLTQDSTANSDGAVLSAGLNDVLFSLSGGDSALSVSVFYNGSNRDDLLSYDSSSGDYTLALPDSGAFAGTYTLTVTDSQGFSASWYLERPLALTAGVTPLLLVSGSQQPLTITGAPAATSIALSSSDTSLSFATTDGSATTLVTATDDATAFNPASVLLVTDTALTTALSATVTASASNIPDSSAALIFALPRSVLFTVNDSDGNPITAADISSDDGRFSLWNLPASATSSSDGSVSMQLPDEEITLSVSADGYRTGSVTVSAGDSDASVTLISADSAYTLYGIVSASGFTFIDENPQLTLWFSDDSSETLSVTSITASTVRYRWQGDLTVATPVYLALSHSQAETAEISLDTSLSEQRLNVTLELITDSTATESSGTVTSSSSTGGGAGALLWFILGLLLLWPRPARGQLNSSQ